MNPLVGIGSVEEHADCFWVVLQSCAVAHNCSVEIVDLMPLQDMLDIRITQTYYLLKPFCFSFSSSSAAISVESSIFFSSCSNSLQETPFLRPTLEASLLSQIP